jgi:hypothetical protein
VGGHGAASLPWSQLPSPVRRDTAPDCEVGTSPHIPRGCVVVWLRRTHSAIRKRGLAVSSVVTHDKPGRCDSTADEANERMRRT